MVVRAAASEAPRAKFGVALFHNDTSKVVIDADRMPALTLAVGAQFVVVVVAVGAFSVSAGAAISFLLKGVNEIL